MKEFRNPEPKIGTGRLFDRDVVKLAQGSPWRRCERELVGVGARPDQRCSMPVLPFEAGCRHHITDAERDAQLMARIAFRLGVARGRKTTDKDPVWPEPPQEIDTSAY